jgi:hypothetical protein
LEIVQLESVCGRRARARFARNAEELALAAPRDASRRRRYAGSPAPLVVLSVLSIVSTVAAGYVAAQTGNRRPHVWWLAKAR